MRVFFQLMLSKLVTGRTVGLVARRISLHALRQLTGGLSWTGQVRILTVSGDVEQSELAATASISEEASAQQLESLFFAVGCVCRQQVLAKRWSIFWVGVLG